MNTNYIIYNGELYHHGVKGMKWGVRKAIKNDRKRFRQEEYRRLRKEYDIEGKSQAAYKYGEKHKLDLDDGGGGSVRAGRKYMKMWEDIEALDDKAYENAKKYTDKRLIKKYGEQTIESFKKREISRQNAAIAATVFSMMAIPAATVIGLIATDPNLRK